MLRMHLFLINVSMPWWLSSKESACNPRDLGLTSVLGRTPGEGKGNPFQYPCLGNPRTEDPSESAFHGVTKKSDTT